MKGSRGEWLSFSLWKSLRKVLFLFLCVFFVSTFLCVCINFTFQFPTLPFFYHCHATLSLRAGSLARVRGTVLEAEPSSRIWAFSQATQHSFQPPPPPWGGPLHDDTKNGCEGEFSLTDWVFELSDWLFVQLTDSLFISYLRNIFLIDWFRWYISALVTLATNNDVTTRNEIKTNSSLKHKIVAKEHYFIKASYAHFSGNAINTSNNTRVFNTKLCRGYPWTWRSVVTSLPQPYGWRIFCADVKLFHILSKI